VSCVSGADQRSSTPWASRPCEVQRLFSYYQYSTISSTDNFGTVPLCMEQDGFFGILPAPITCCRVGCRSGCRFSCRVGLVAASLRLSVWCRTGMPGEPSHCANPDDNLPPRTPRDGKRGCHKPPARRRDGCASSIPPVPRACVPSAASRLRAPLTAQAVAITVKLVRVGREHAEATVRGNIPTVEVGRRRGDADIRVGGVTVAA
jgi:hypothetical protein